MTLIYEQHGFEVLRHSMLSIEATVRVSRDYKYTFLGPLTFEKKVTDRYGTQCIIVVRMDKSHFPVLEKTPYRVDYPRIEILVPESIALSMRLLRR